MLVVQSEKGKLPDFFQYRQPSNVIIFRLLEFLETMPLSSDYFCKQTLNVVNYVQSQTCH